MWASYTAKRNIKFSIWTVPTLNIISIFVHTTTVLLIHTDRFPVRGAEYKDVIDPFTITLTWLSCTHYSLEQVLFP